MCADCRRTIRPATSSPRRKSRSLRSQPNRSNAAESDSCFHERQSHVPRHVQIKLTDALDPRPDVAVARIAHLPRPNLTARISQFGRCKGRRYQFTRCRRMSWLGLPNPNQQILQQPHRGRKVATIRYNVAACVSWNCIRVPGVTTVSPAVNPRRLWAAVVPGASGWKLLVLIATLRPFIETDVSCRLSG